MYLKLQALKKCHYLKNLFWEKHIWRKQPTFFIENIQNKDDLIFFLTHYFLLMKIAILTYLLNPLSYDFDFIFYVYFDKTHRKSEKVGPESPAGPGFLWWLCNGRCGVLIRARCLLGGGHLTSVWVWKSS